MKFSDAIAMLREAAPGVRWAHPRGEGHMHLSLDASGILRLNDRKDIAVDTSQELEGEWIVFSDDHIWFQRPNEGRLAPSHTVPDEYDAATTFAAYILKTMTDRPTFPTDEEWKQYERLARDFVIAWARKRGADL